MQRFALYFSLFLLFCCVIVDPALANKFETISGGVNGMNKEKIRLLKDISLYAGGFLVFLAILSIITRNRFEGFVGYSSRSDSSSTLQGATILTVAGTLFIGLSFL